VLLGCSMFVIFILIGAIFHGFFYKKRGSKIDRNGSFSEMNLRCLTYKELQEATDGFKEELGRGAFGIVYKGAIKMGSNVLHVAVKKLNSGAQKKEMEFKAEVEIIGKTYHNNSVVAMASDRYTASMLDLETIGCFLAVQDIKQSPRNTAKPDVDLLSSGHPAQSESQNAFS
jgi:hypothetical protein